MELAALLGANRESAPERCRIRLYGGWFDGAAHSPQAKRLIPEIDQAFPQAVMWSARGWSAKCITQVEMAVGLEADPGRHLFRTLRKRPYKSQLLFNETFTEDCSDDGCPMRVVAKFLQDQRCPRSNCSVTQGDVLSKWEQKLVDTMLVSDLILLASRKEEDLVVVSSDDDIWPGVRTAVHLGAQVTLIHTGMQFPSTLNFQP